MKLKKLKRLCPLIANKKVFVMGKRMFLPRFFNSVVMESETLSECFLPVYGITEDDHIIRIQEWITPPIGGNIITQSENKHLFDTDMDDWHYWFRERRISSVVCLKKKRIIRFRGKRGSSFQFISQQEWLLYPYFRMRNFNISNYYSPKKDKLIRKRERKFREKAQAIIDSHEDENWYEGMYE